MENMIIIAVLILVIALALFRAKRHFKGGGCCGSGTTTIRSRKKLTAPKIGEKALVIEGMHCENCQIRVENALNRLDCVEAKVNLRRKTATVAFSADISDAVLKETVEKMGYQVTDIQ